MVAYWCGAITPHESSRAGQFIQQEVSSYDSMRNLLIKLDAGNVHTDQIVLLFTASHSTDEIRNRHSLTQSVSKERRSWSADCDVLEEVVELVQTKVINPAPVGWLVKVRITREEWRSEKCRTSMTKSSH